MVLSLFQRLAAPAAALALLLVPSLAQACRCLPFESTLNAYEEADRVFSGEVLEVASPEADHFYVRVVLDERRAWKGGDADGEVVILTTSSPAACGVTFRHGVIYLIFAYDEGEYLTTNTCSGTVPLADGLKEAKDLDEIVAGQGTN
ncbi:MAG: hypothetical protein AAF495_06485 [Pseudomonadota bacterium]